ncbi:retropepsin-like aspartic protease [Sphingobium algorifonticola]|uniref:retropepsin-like aspartic protease n=1 Tax=Sphingobium algorifonticola TaxID=2008318 RepID=UPI0013E3B04A|nr:retropepsin-like aspartic protease [Sphingobium algorifonticola]
MYIFGADNPADLTHVTATALVDTGATVSAIDQRIAEELRLESHGKRPLQSAHGLGHAERFIFRIGLFPDNSAANALPFIFEETYGFSLKSSEHFAALIGMDVLRQCDFSIDRAGNCCLVFG